MPKLDQLISIRTLQLVNQALVHISKCDEVAGILQHGTNETSAYVAGTKVNCPHAALFHDSRLISSVSRCSTRVQQFHLGLLTPEK